MSLSETPYDALRDMDGAVIKYGGDNTADLREVHDNGVLHLFEDDTVISVLSAARSSNEEKYGKFRHPDVPYNPQKSSDKGFNTTTHLILAAESLADGNKEKAIELIQSVQSFTIAALVDSLEVDERSAIIEKVTEVCSAFTSEVANFSPESGDVVYVEPNSKDSYIKKDDGRLIPISGFGENLIRSVHAVFNPEATEVALEAGYKIKANGEGVDRESLIIDTQARKTVALRSAVKDSKPRLVAGGHAFGTASMRGYSEMEGMDLAVTLQKETGSDVAMVIAKKFPIMSKDPTSGGRARVVQNLTREMAEELFGNVFGADAGAVQAEALDEAVRQKMDVFILNPADVRTGSISRIHDFSPQAGGVDIVGKKPIASFSVRHERDMPRGELSELVRQWAKDNRVHYVDRDGKTETASTFYFQGNYDKGFFDDLESKIAQEFFKKVREVKAQTKKAAIYQLGNNMGSPGVTGVVGRAYAQADINIEGQLQGESSVSMRQFIRARDADKAVEAIHLLAVETSPEDLYDMSDRDVRKLFEERGIN